MKLRHLATAAALWALTVIANAAGSLVSGPMLGYNAHREVLVWLEVKDAKSVELAYWPAGKPEAAERLIVTLVDRDRPEAVQALLVAIQAQRDQKIFAEQLAAAARERQHRRARNRPVGHLCLRLRSRCPR